MQSFPSAAARRFTPLSGDSRRSCFVARNLNLRHKSSVISAACRVSLRTRAQVCAARPANGNLVSDGLRSFEYDANNRLAQVNITKDFEAAKITYLHNAAGQRVFKSEPQTAQALPDEQALGTGFVDWLRRNFQWLYATAQTNASIGTAYSFADQSLPSWALLGEYDNGSASGAGRVEYIWLPQEDGNAIPIAMFRGSRYFNIHSDHLGTPRLIKDDSAKPTWQWAYSAFGDNKPTGILRATTNPNAAITNQPTLLQATGAMEFNLRFPGQYLDQETGQFYNYFRTYDPKSGRYTQNDPIGLGGGANRFGYAGGNALSFSDPTGEIVINPVTVALGLGLLGSGAIIINSQNGNGASSSSSSSSSSLQSEIEREANRREYKRICEEKPPPGLTDPCERAKWELNKAKSCLAAREENTNRWWGGKDTKHNAQLHTDLLNQLKTAEKAVERWCQCK